MKQNCIAGPPGCPRAHPCRTYLSRCIVVGLATTQPCRINDGGTPNGKAITLSAQALKDALSIALAAAAKETSRYAIQGVLLESDKTGTRFVATDGRRLVITELDPAQRRFRGKVIIPSRVAWLVGKLIDSKATGGVHVFVKEDAGSDRTKQPADLYLVGLDWILASEELEGHFPVYHDVVPQSHSQFFVDRRAASRAGPRHEQEGLAVVRVGLLESRAEEAGVGIVNERAGPIRGDPRGDPRGGAIATEDLVACEVTARWDKKPAAAPGSGRGKQCFHLTPCPSPGGRRGLCLNPRPRCSSPAAVPKRYRTSSSIPREFKRAGPSRGFSHRVCNSRFDQSLTEHQPQAELLGHPPHELR
jgi:hypothetical protein